MSAVMRPARGRKMPMMHFIRVDLPLPLVPSSTTVSPGLASIDTCSRTRTAPYAASTFSMVMLLAKVGSNHLGVAHHLLGQTVGDFLSGDKHDKPLRERPHGAHAGFD